MDTKVRKETILAVLKKVKAKAKPPERVTYKPCPERQASPGATHVSGRAVARARMAAHEAFDLLWKSGKMSRGKAYMWMQTAMGLGADEAHIGMFGVAECEDLIHLVNKRWA